MKKFEDYLKEIHAETYTGTDDTMPDAFEHWLSNLGMDELMDYATDYGKVMFNKGAKIVYSPVTSS